MPAFDPNERPTKEIIDKQIAYFEKLWHQAHVSMEKADSYYFQTNNIWENLTERQQISRPKYHSPRATALVNKAVDAHLAFEPKWHRRPVGEGEAHKEKADRLERGLDEVIRHAILSQQRFHTKVNGKQLVRHNYTQIHVSLSEDMLNRPVKKDGESQEDFDQREDAWAAQRGAWNPIDIEVPSAGEVLMDPTRKWPLIAIRRRKVLALDLSDLVKQKARRQDVTVMDGYEIEKDAYDDVEIVEWWSPRFTAIQRKSGGLVYVEPNFIGFVPFAHVWGGSADMPMGEEFDPDWYVKQALLFSVMDDLKMEAQARAANQEIIQRTAFAKSIYNGDTSEAAQQMLDDILQGKPDQWGIEKVPELSDKTFQHQEELARSIEIATYSLQEAGIRERGADTATATLIRSEAGNRTFKAAIKQMEGLWSIAGTMALRLWATMAKEYPYGDVLQVGEHPLKVEDMEGEYHIEATFEQVDVVVAMQEAAQANDDLEKQLIDYETWARIRRFEDPTGIRDGIVKDSIRAMPEVMIARQIVALREAGFMEIADEKEEELRKARLQRQAGGLVNPQGQPIASQSTNGVPHA